MSAAVLGSMTGNSSRFRGPLQVRPLATHRVGAENSVTSRDLHVLVDQTTEPVASQRPNDGSGGWWGTARGRAVIQRSMRTVGVVMPDVLV